MFGAAIGFVLNMEATRQTFGDTWLFQGNQIVFWSVSLGAIVATLAMLAFSILAPRHLIMVPSDPSEATFFKEQEKRPRFRFGIGGLMGLTACLAILVAIPTNILASLATSERLAMLIVEVKILLLALVILVSPIMLWIVLRAPVIASRLVTCVRTIRGIKQDRKELQVLR
jgi:hypothetical protein